MRHPRCHFLGDAAPFVSHDQNASVFKAKGTSVEVVSVEERAIDGHLFGHFVQEGGKIDIVHPHSCHCAHRGLHDFRGIDIGCLGGSKDVADAKPICGAKDGAEIPGVLHAVQCQTEFAGRKACFCLRVFGISGKGKKGKHAFSLGRMNQTGKGVHFGSTAHFGRHAAVSQHGQKRKGSLRHKQGDGAHAAGNQVCHQTLALCHKKTLALATFLLTQRVHKFHNSL